MSSVGMTRICSKEFCKRVVFVGFEPARAYSQIATGLSVVEFVDVQVTLPLLHITLASLAQDTIYDRNSGFITFQNRLTPRIPDKDVRKNFRDW